MKNYKDYAIRIIEHMFKDEYDTITLLESWNKDNIAMSMIDEMFEILYDMYEQYDYTSMQQDVNGIYTELCNFPNTYYYTKLNFAFWEGTYLKLYKRRLNTYDIITMLDTLRECFNIAKEEVIFNLDDSCFITEFDF